MTENRYFIIFAFVLFSVVFFIFFPSNYGIVDEAAYLTTTYSLAKGHTFFYDEVGFGQVPMMVTTPNGHTVSKYPPGNSLLLLPFAAFGWRLIFLRGLLLTGLGLLLFTMLLDFYRIPKIYALLFLFFPPFVLYSRTIMSDMPAMLLASAGLYFFVTKKEVWAGIILGLGVCVRYPLALLLVAFALVLLAKKEFRAFVTFSVAALFSVALLLPYHLLVFRNILGSALQYGSDLGFTIHWNALRGYALSLLLLYPLMLILPFFYKGKDSICFLFPAVLYFLFHAFQSYIDTSADFIQWLVMSQRYMLPIIPFLLVPYAAVLDRIKIMRKLIIPVSLALVTAGIFINHRHAQFLKMQDRYQRLMYHYVGSGDMMICNQNIFELVNPYIEYIKWTPFEKQRKLTDVDVLPGDKKTTFLACLARDYQIKLLFLETLEKFPLATELYKEDAPYYFSIWRVDREEANDKVKVKSQKAKVKGVGSKE